MIFVQLRNNRFNERLRKNHPSPPTHLKNDHQGFIKPQFDCLYKDNPSPQPTQMKGHKNFINFRQKLVDSFEQSNQKRMNEKSVNLSFQNQYCQPLQNIEVKTINEDNLATSHSLANRDSPSKKHGNTTSKRKPHYLTVVSRLPLFKPNTKSSA